MTRRALAKWKFIMLRRFYGAKKSSGEGGLLMSVRRALSGLFHRDDHATKLETVARNALISGIETIRTAFGPRYMGKAAEREMFATWDDIYRHIQEQKLASGVTARASVDAADLHRANVIYVLAKEHATRRTVAVVPS
jgi:hypothetical protein